MLGPFCSSLATGMVFGLGFDTATQISAITLSAVASATVGFQAALVLTGFFAIGMVPLDTLDSVILRSAFSRIFNTKAFRYMSYALSGAAMSIAGIASYEIVTGHDILPDLTDPILTGIIIGTTFGCAFAISRRAERRQVLQRLYSKDYSYLNNEDGDQDMYFGGHRK